MNRKLNGKTALIAPGVVVIGLLLVGPTSASAVTCDSLTTTINGSSASQVLRGTDGRDIISAAGGDDLIVGLGGDDVICGGDGADTFKSGSGDDVALGEAGTDTIKTASGDDEANPGACVTACAITTDMLWTGSGDDHVDLPGGGNKVEASTGSGSDRLTAYVVAPGGTYQHPSSAYPHYLFANLGDGGDVAELKYHASALVFGGPGDDHLAASCPDYGSVSLSGESGDDTVWGYYGDYCFGTSYVYGGLGSDFVGYATHCTPGVGSGTTVTGTAPQDATAGCTFVH